MSEGVQGGTGGQCPAADGDAGDEQERQQCGEHAEPEQAPAVRGAEFRHRPVTSLFERNAC